MTFFVDLIRYVPALLVVGLFGAMFGLLVGLGVLAAVKLISIVVLVILGLLAIAASVGATIPVKRTTTHSAVFAATPDQVWAVISNPGWGPGHVGCEVLPANDGHRTWVLCHEWFKPHTVKAVEWDPPSKLVLKPVHRRRYVDSSCTYRIEPVDGGSLLTIIGDADLYNPIDRFFERYPLRRRDKSHWKICDEMIRWHIEHPASDKQPDQ